MSLFAVGTPASVIVRSTLSAPSLVAPFTDLDAFVKSANATVVDGRFASTDGEPAEAAWGVYGPPESWRLNFTVKVTKSEIGSESMAGITVGGATIPHQIARQYSFLFGYRQGMGLMGRFENVGPVEAAFIEDDELEDGEEYVLSFTYNRILPGNFYLYGVVSRPDGSYVDIVATQVHPSGFPLKNVLIRTNVETGGLRNVMFRGNATAPLPANGRPSWHSFNDRHDGTQDVFLRIPIQPLLPLRLVVVCHGHGQSAFSTLASAGTFWMPIERAGFCLVGHQMHGDSWGNDQALADVATLVNDLRDQFEVAERVHVIGQSMGGVPAANLVALDVLPVASVYCGVGVFDLGAISEIAPFSFTVAAAYPTEADRDANDPMLHPAESYGDVPFLLGTSPDDNVVPMGTHSQPFAAKLGDQATLIIGTGDHTAITAGPTGTEIADFFLANP